MPSIGRAVHALGSGFTHAFKGASHMVKGAFTLDLKRATHGAAELVRGGAKVATGAAGFAAPSLCASTLMDGALHALSSKLQKK